MMIKKFIKLMVVIVVASLWNLSCGTSKEVALPSPNDPDKQNPIDEPIPTDPKVKTGVPSLVGAVPIALKQAPHTSDLETLFGKIVHTPIVGDPWLKLTLTTVNEGGTMFVQGTLLIGFEDAKYWRHMTQKHFAKGGLVNHERLDVIFEDNLVITRVLTARNGNELNGKVFFRIRNRNTDPIITYWYLPIPNFNTNFLPLEQRPRACEAFQWMCGTHPCTYQSDVFSPCRNFMAINQSEVIELGSFEARLSDWINN